VEVAGRVILAAWAAGLKQTVRMQAWKWRAAPESEQTGRSSHERPDVRALVLSYMEDDSLLEYDGICTTMVSSLAWSKNRLIMHHLTSLETCDAPFNKIRDSEL